LRASFSNSVLMRFFTSGSRSSARCTTSKIQRTGAATIAAVVFFAIAVYRISPPVEGYYRSPIVAILDGSAGYLHFHDGSVDVVNIGGSGGDSREAFGTYRKLGRSKIQIVFKDPQLPSNTVSVGWFGFEWSEDLAQGWPDGNHCQRELLPWRVNRLNQFR
jgi:hypothetical protein